MGIQENINRSIGSLSRLLGLIKIKESIKFKDLISDDTKTVIKNTQEAQEKILKGEAKLTRREKKKLEKYTADLEEKTLNTPKPEYTRVAKDAEIPADFDIDAFEASIDEHMREIMNKEVDETSLDDDIASLESSPPNRMNPFMAAERAQTAVDDKQLEYSFSKPKATILPFEPKESKKATILPFEPKDSKKATILPFEPKD